MENLEEEYNKRLKEFEDLKKEFADKKEKINQEYIPKIKKAQINLIDITDKIIEINEN